MEELVFGTAAARRTCLWRTPHLLGRWVLWVFLALLNGFLILGFTFKAAFAAFLPSWFAMLLGYFAFIGMLNCMQDGILPIMLASAS